MSNNIEILFENDDVLVVDKPVGLLVHEDGHNEGETLVDWFLHRQPEAAGVGEPGYSSQGKLLERSGVVHRLDRNTSGVMILAKKQETFTYLKDQFQKRAVKKTYIALVYGLMKEEWGTISKPIGRSPSDYRKRLSGRGAVGSIREAETDWRCLKTGQYNNEPFSYLQLNPKTGRTHQIRVHLRSISRPVVGDNLYAESEMSKSNNLELDRMALHALELRLSLPGGEEKVFTSSVPHELAEAIELIEK